MARYVIQFTSSAHPGGDEAFNRWYDDVHMRDVLGVPGFMSCQRYRVIDQEATPRYVAAYDVDTNDPQASLGLLFEASKKMVISPYLDPESVSITVMQPGSAIRRP